TRETIARILLAIVVMALIWLARRVFIRVVLRWARQITRRTTVSWDDVIVNSLEQPARFLAAALAISVGATIIGFNPTITTVINNVVGSLVIIAIFVAVFKAVDILTPTTYILEQVTGMRVDEQLLPFLRTAVKVIIIALVFVIVAEQWGYNVSALVAGIGVGGLAVSLAAKDSVENLFGFSTIVADDPFNVGEFIVMDGISGTVEKVGMRSTRIRQLDQAVVYVPNNRLANGVVTNWSRLEKRRMDFTIGVTYATTADEMRELLQRIKDLLAARDTVDEESIQVLFSNFGASSLDILIRGYIMLPDWHEWMLEMEQIYLAIMDIVEAMGLGFAFPSQSIYVEQMP
ncbi:MAG: hypothetical protein CUN54_09110, partial [Phototrophicales bacterium]